MNADIDPGSGPFRSDDGRPRVVVGVDGSPGSRVALIHALTAASQRGAELEVVSCCPVTPVWTGGYALATPDPEAIRADAMSRTAGFVDDVLRSAAEPSGVHSVDVRLVVSEARPVPELVKRSENADLLVIGSRGRGGVRSALLGSVALHCATHARCPVVVVHPTSAVAEAPRVVVGVDGSAGSRAALVAALQEARRTGAEVEVVATYFPVDSWTDATLVLASSVEVIRADLQRRTGELVADVVREERAAGGAPRVSTTVHEGPATDVLLRRARSAQLLVVGSRGRGAMRGLLLGSVALNCAMHATAPVMVVHPQRARATTADSGSEPAMAGI